MMFAKIKKCIPLPVALFLGYLLSSLLAYDEVNYFNLDEKKIKFYLFFIVLSTAIYFFIYFLVFTKKGNKFCLYFKIFKKEEFDVYFVLGAILTFCLLFFITSYCWFYDYSVHCDWAIEFDFSNIINSMRYRTYPFWHISVGILHKGLHIPIKYASGIISATFVTLTYCVARKLFLLFTDNCVEKDNKRYFLVNLFTFILLFLQTIYLPFFNNNHFMGQGSGNTYHNPTNIAVKPFALLCVILFIDFVKEDYLKDATIKTYTAKTIRLAVFLALSAFAKPSFVQIFFPAVAVYYLVAVIKSTDKKKTFFEILRFGVCCIVPMMFVILAFATHFMSTQGENQTIIAFASLWSEFTNSIPFSIFLAIAFPLVYALAYKKEEFKDINTYLPWLILLIGILEFMFLEESGSKREHANFMWGYNLGIFIVFAFSMANLLKKILFKEFKPKLLSDGRCVKSKLGILRNVLVIISLVLLLLHIVFGIHYYAYIVKTNNYF